MATQALYPNLNQSADCASAAAPAAKFAECMQTFTQHKSQINQVLLCDPDGDDPTIPATAMAAPTDITAWETAIGDNTTAGGWRKLDVIGDLPEPEQSSRTVSKGRVANGNSVFNLNFDVDDTTDENYAYMIHCQSAPEKFMYYADFDNIYGPVKCQVTKAAAPKSRGEESYDTFVYTVTFEHPHNPPRAVSPFTS